MCNLRRCSINKTCTRKNCHTHRTHKSISNSESHCFFTFPRDETVITTTTLCINYCCSLLHIRSCSCIYDKNGLSSFKCFASYLCTVTKSFESNITNFTNTKTSLHICFPPFLVCINYVNGTILLPLYL